MQFVQSCRVVNVLEDVRADHHIDRPAREANILDVHNDWRQRANRNLDGTPVGSEKAISVKNPA